MSSKLGAKFCLSFLYPALFSFGLSSCNDEDVAQLPEPVTFIYHQDGRVLEYGDPSPMLLDVNGDEKVDYVLFMELTANSQGDYLNIGINPIGGHLIKSGVNINENYLNMGFTVAHNSDDLIDDNLAVDQIWTNDYSALVIKHTPVTGEIKYNGNWINDEQIAGIQIFDQDVYYYGWLRLKFNQENESITLIDYAYEQTADKAIKAGASL